MVLVEVVDILGGEEFTSQLHLGGASVGGRFVITHVDSSEDERLALRAAALSG